MRETRAMPDRVSIVGIVAGAIAVMTAIAIAVSAGFVATRVANERDPAFAASAPPPVQGDVVLQRAPARNIAQFEAEKRRLIGEYGWVDRERGIARVPVARAMELLVHRAGEGARR